MQMLEPSTRLDDPPCYALSEQSDLDAAAELTAIAHRLQRYSLVYAAQDDEYGVANEVADLLLEEAGRLEARADQ